MSARDLRRTSFFKSLWIASVMALALLLAAGGFGFASDSAAVAPLTGNGQKDAHLFELDRTASDIVRHVEEGSLEQALGLVGVMGRQLAELPWMERTSLEGAEGMIRSVVELKSLLTAVRPNLPEIRRAAVRVRLASDALLFREEPMWKQYEPAMRQELEKLRQAAVAGNERAIRQQYEALAAHALLIRPAAIISGREAEMNRLTSVLTALRGKLEDRLTDADQLMPLLGHADEALRELFAYGDKPAHAPVSRRLYPLVWSLLIGGYIVFVLFVVGKSKYAFDKGYISVSARMRNRK
jgi:sporulation protein YpjB